VVGVVATAVAQVDPAEEGDVLMWSAGVAQHHELLVVRAARAHPHVEHDLPSGLVDHVTEVAVLLAREGELVPVGSPDQAPHVDPPTGGAGQQGADLAARLAEQALVGVTAPVDEHQQVTGRHRAHAPVQLGEVRHPVHERAHRVALCPGPAVGVARVEHGVAVPALAGREEPVGGGHHASLARGCGRGTGEGRTMRMS